MNWKLLTIIPLLFAFISCGKSGDDEPSDGSQEIANKLNGTWVSHGINNTKTYTFVAYPKAKDITNVDGAAMTFNGTLNEKSVYGSSGSLDFDFNFFFKVNPTINKIDAWSMSEDKKYWTPVIHSEYKYTFNADGTLSLKGDYGTDTFIKQ